MAPARVLGCSVVSMVLTMACGAARESAEMIASGDTLVVRERPEGAPARSPARPGLLVVAIDGVDRDLLYDLLREGELPGMSRLLSSQGGELEHAHLDETTLSTLPSTTMAAWVTTFSGKPPAVHGITGNELFARENRRFIAPVPVTFDDIEPMLENYTEGYTNRHTLVPSVFQRMRARDPHVLIWAAMLPYHAGVDVLFKTDRGVLIDAARAYLAHELEETVSDEEAYTIYETIDEETTESVIETLEDEDAAVADVIAIYYMGTDQYAHIASQGPDKARREYLKRALDPEFEELASALRRRNALANRYVVIVSDHGHTPVKHDARHALGTEEQGDPPEVLTKAGFRVRPFELEVDDDHDFSAVLAYQGAIAYVYVADRSTCPRAGTACDWKRPPRFRADVLAAADAFFRASQDGSGVGAMRGTLDLVLARRPKPAPEVDLPFEVYVGGGRLVPVSEWLRRHPRPSYVAFEERLRDLAVGPAGERAGDVLLLANNANRKRPEQRYYFSNEYHSWHGSPGARDSELPLVVGHAGKSSAELERVVRGVLGARGRQHEIADLLLALRYGPAR
jgi:hypothetical protein